jgi:hypothetical protein
MTMKRVLVVLAVAVSVSSAAAFTTGASTKVASGLAGGARAKRASFAPK